MGMTKRIAFLLGTVLTLSLLSTQARAHWCHDLWGSAYNIVVRPASDTVTVPSSGSANLEIFVQNNMGYLLPNFVLSAKTADTTTKITVSRQTQKVANTLMPGEKAKYTLAVSKSGGGSVAVGDITFGVTFGNSGQSGAYPNSPGKAVMIKKADGSLVPAAPPPGIGTGNSQARQLQHSAVADFSNVDTGLDKLMSLYCAGRKSWGADDDSVMSGACSGTATDCTKATRSVAAGIGTKFDYTKLWAAGELAARKASLGARAATLRTRLQCGASDANLAFAGFSMMVMGYLGDDAGARTFLEGKAGTTDLGTIAKAALVLMGDKAKYASDMTAGMKASSKVVQAACAAAVGIVNADDASVNSVLLPLAKWEEPSGSTAGELGIYASHLLAMVAWDRRGWAANAADKGPVSFYGDTSTPPVGGSTGTAGTSGAAGAAGSTGNPPPPAGTTSSGGGAKGGAVASGGATPPKGGSTTVNPPAGNATPGSSSKGGNTTTPPVGGNVPPASTGNPPGGGTPGGAGNSGAAGNAGTGNDSQPVGGNSGSEQGTDDPLGVAGNGGASNGSAAKSSGAGGCNYGQTDPAPFAFLLAGLGLALALRRRGR
jgi:MYXO-CTERM domain-containing protein